MIEVDKHAKIQSVWETITTQASTSNTIGMIECMSIESVRLGHLGLQDATSITTWTCKEKKRKLKNSKKSNSTHKKKNVYQRYNQSSRWADCLHGGGYVCTYHVSTCQARRRCSFSIVTTVCTALAVSAPTNASYKPVIHRCRCRPGAFQPVNNVRHSNLRINCKFDKYYHDNNAM